MLQEVLKRIKPSDEEEKEIKSFLRRLLQVSETISGYECVVCGSIGKLTWLRGDHDIDLFIMFDDVPRKELEEKGLAFGKRIITEMGGKYVIKYAEHPYVHGIIGKYTVDVVPCYRISRGQAIKSAVDRSPLHLVYIVEHISEAQRDEARLLKQFCKGISVYGSDTRHRGFSGYICELLILQYKDFHSVLKSAKNWELPKAISLEDVIVDAKKHFPDQALIVIDPVDSKRNAAANASAENLVKFILSAKRFLDKPDKSFFFKESRPLSANELKMLAERKTKFLVVSFKRPDVIDDVLYPQLRRSLSRLRAVLEENDFSVVRSYEFSNGESILLFELASWHMPDIKKMIGPPIFSKKHSNEFLSKYKNAYLEENTWVAEKKREFLTPDMLLKNFLKKDVARLRDSGIPENIAVAIRSAKILEGNEFLKLVKKNKELSAFLREKYFTNLNLY